MNDKPLISDVLLDGSELKHMVADVRCKMLGGLGWEKKDLVRRPMIGIVNSFTDINPGHAHLDKLAQAVREGVLQAGGVPFEFNTPAPCDAYSGGLSEMKCVLPQRDLIADSIEMMVRSHYFDGLVFLSTCDKIVPGQLMAAARLNLPAIFVTGGASLPNQIFAPKGTEDLMERYYKSADPAVQEELFCYSCSSHGACSGFGTANTMQGMAEVLGLTLPMCATVHAIDPRKTQLARQSGRRVVEMVWEGLNARSILTRDAFENAIAVHTAVGGSTNAVLHLIAIAHEAKIDLSVDDFERIGAKLPCICGVKPSGKYTQLDLHRAGGFPAVEKRVASYLHLDARNVLGTTLAQIVEKAVIADEDVIHSFDRPFYEGSGLAILHGNLCPNTAVVKASAVRRDMLVHSGPAKVYDNEADARCALDRGEIEAGNVLVIRYEGPKGGPGMGEMFMITQYLAYSGKADSVALVTDGRFSGFTCGPAVGHVCPEAAEGGPIALIENGDLITIDIPDRTLTLHVDEAELARRKAAWVPYEREAEGYLARYAKHVRSAAEGAWVE